MWGGPSGPRGCGPGSPPSPCCAQGLPGGARFPWPCLLGTCGLCAGGCGFSAPSYLPVHIALHSALAAPVTVRASLGEALWFLLTQFRETSENRVSKNSAFDSGCGRVWGRGVCVGGWGRSGGRGCHEQEVCGFLQGPGPHSGLTDMLSEVLLGHPLSLSQTPAQPSPAPELVPLECRSRGRGSLPWALGCDPLWQEPACDWASAITAFSPSPTLPSGLGVTG